MMHDADAIARRANALIALSVSTYLVNRQKQRAEANLKTALDVVDAFFLTVSENRLLNEPGMQPLRAELLTSAVRFAEKFKDENADDPARQADVARVKLLLGRVLIRLKDAERARALLTEARDLYAEMARADPSAVEPLRGQALATLSLGVLEFEGNPAAAEQPFRDAIERYERLREAAPSSPEAHEKLALAWNGLASVHKVQGKLHAAAPAYEKAIALVDELTKADPANLQYVDQLAGYNANYAEVWLKKNDLPQARMHIEASWALRQKLADGGVRNLDFEDSMADSQNHLGILALREKRFPQAEADFRKALALRTALARRNPDVPKWRTSQAKAHFSLSQPLAQQSRYPEALAEMDKCVDLLEAIVREAPNDPTANLNLGWGRLCKSYYLYDSRRLAAAEDELTRAIDRLEAGRAHSPERGVADAVNAYWTRGMVRVDRGRFREAVADYDRAIQLEPGPQREALTRERDAAARKANP